MYNARAEPLFCSLNVLFSDVLDAVVVVLSCPRYTCQGAFRVHPTPKLRHEFRSCTPRPRRQRQDKPRPSIKGLGPGSLPYLRKIHKVRRAENFSGNEQNSSRIRLSEQNFEQNKRFLRVMPASRISHFTSRIYQALHPPTPR